MANRVPFDDRGNSLATLLDVSKLLVRDFLVQTKSKLSDDVETLPLVNVLEQMDLLTTPKEQMKIKNAALMLFSYALDRFFPKTQVDIVIYLKGKDEDPDNFMELDPIKCPIHLIIKKVWEYLNTMVIRQRISKVSPKEKL